MVPHWYGTTLAGARRRAATWALLALGLWAVAAVGSAGAEDGDLRALFDAVAGDDVAGGMELLTGGGYDSLVGAFRRASEGDFSALLRVLPTPQGAAGILPAIYDTICLVMKVAFDTDVIVASRRSRSGASHILLHALQTGEIKAVASVPMMLEYEAVLVRPTAPRHRHELAGRAGFP